MLVPAMVVVVMVVTMAMIVVLAVIIMAVLMIAMIVMIMVMTVRMIMAGMTVLVMRMTMGRAGIGAAFGIEGRLDLDDAGAETLHHRLDDVIAADTQALGHDLRRQVAVAEMPGDPDQMMRVGALDLEQRLGRRHHLDQPSVLEHQRIAAAERNGVFEIEQEFEPARACHRHPPPVPVVEIEHDGIGRSLFPAMLSDDSCGADHAEILSTLASLMISITVGEALSGADSARHVFMCGARP